MVLVGRLKVPYQDLFFYTVQDLHLLLKGHEIDKRDDWDRTRVGGYISIIPDLKKGSKITPAQLYPMPWDKKEDNSTFIDRAKEKLEKFKKLWQN